ncbi:MAG: prefoldin subunit alpha [Euryarchaeota archaeon]|nr:prefoldin subunit alpha [Euryarchaeota archaeon]
MDEHEIEKTLNEYEYYRAQAEALKRNMDLINTSLAELEMIGKSLDEIKKLGKQNEILMPIGGDSFVKASIVDADKILINLGAGVVAEKDISNAKGDFEQRIKELEQVRGELAERWRAVSSKLEELAPKVQEIIASQEGRRG